MSIDRVLGQAHAIGRIKGLLSGDRVPHAMAFAGPRGTGKRMAAVGVAKTLVCAERSGDFCDACIQCQRVEHGNHPNIYFLALKPKEPAYRIATLREELLHPVYMAAVEEGPKLFILDDAHKIPPAGQNAILKTLEEPPAGTLIILLVEELPALLDTVRSRLQVVSFAPVEAEVMRERIRELRPEAAGDQVELAVRFARGSFARALEILDGGDAFLEAKRRIVAAMASATPDKVLTIADEMLATVGQAAMATDVSERHARRSRAAGAAEVMLLALRDAALLAAAGDESKVVNADQVGALRALGARLGVEGACRMAELVRRSRQQLTFNVNADMMMKRLALELASPGRSASSVRGSV